MAVYSLIPLAALAVCLLLPPARPLEQSRLLPANDALLPTLEVAETRTAAGEGRLGENDY